MCAILIKKIAHILYFMGGKMIYLLLFLSCILLLSLFFDYLDEKFCRELSLKMTQSKSVFDDFIVLKTTYSNSIAVSCYVNNVSSVNNLVASWELHNNRLCNFKLFDSKTFKRLKKCYKSLDYK